MAEKTPKLSLVSQASLRTPADKRAGSFVYDQHDFPALRRIRHKTSRQIVPYHEHQVLGMCAVHALNAAVGGCHFTEHQFRTAAELVVDESLAFATAVGKLSEDCLENHMLDSGWFSEQAVAGALQADGRWEFDQTPLRLLPHAYAELASPTVVGAVVQRPGHWFALRVQEGLVWVVDSLQSAPVCLGPVNSAEVDTRLVQFPSSFLIRVRGTVRATPTVRNVEAPPSVSANPRQPAPAPSPDRTAADASQEAASTSASPTVRPVEAPPSPSVELRQPAPAPSPDRTAADASNAAVSTAASSCSPTAEMASSGGSGPHPQTERTLLAEDFGQEVLDRDIDKLSEVAAPPSLSVDPRQRAPAPEPDRTAADASHAAAWKARSLCAATAEMASSGGSKRDQQTAPTFSKRSSDRRCWTEMSADCWASIEPARIAMLSLQRYRRSHPSLVSRAW